MPARTPARPDRVAIAVLVASVMLVVAVRAAGVSKRTFLQHDEAVSYLHAAGKGEAFNRVSVDGREPAGIWTDAGRWRGYLVTESLDPAAVVRSVSRSDRHPPLYYMLLNVWLSVFKDLRSAWAMNTFFAVLGVLGVYALSRRVVDDPSVAALAAMCWAVMPGAVETALTVRPYELLGLLAVLLAWRTIVFLDPTRDPPWTDQLWFAGLSVAGLSTHIYFAIPLTGALVIIVARHWSQQRRRIWITLASTGVASALSVALAPWAWRVVDAAIAQKDAPLLWAERFQRTTQALTSGVGMGSTDLSLMWASAQASGAAGAALWAGFALAVVAALIAWGCRHPLASRDVAASLRRGAAPLFLGAWVTGGVAGLFLTVPALRPAMSARYLTMTWPFVAVGVAVVSAGWRRSPRLFASLMALWLLIIGVTSLRSNPAPRVTELQRGAHRVVVDNVSRGIVLRFAAVLAPDLLMYGAWRDELVENPSRWVGQLEKGDIIVISDTYRSKETPKRLLLALVTADWRIERVEHLGVPAEVWRVVGRSGGEAAWR